MEKILEAHSMTEGSTGYHRNLQEAITLLILARAKTDEKNKKPSKARKHPTGQNSETVKVT